MRPWVNATSSPGGRVARTSHDVDKQQHTLFDKKKRAQKVRERSGREQAFRERNSERVAEGKRRKVSGEYARFTESLKAVCVDVDELTCLCYDGERSERNAALDALSANAQLGPFNSSGGTCMVERQVDTVNIPDVKPWFRSKELTLPAHERERRRARAEFLTRQIATASQQKQLSRAVSAYRQLVTHERLLPTSYTYAALINAYVNSGHMSGAIEVLKRMQAVPGMIPNVVIYTTMLKGHMLSGNVDAAEALVNELCATRKISPLDIRGINTFLRTCQRVGDTPRALNMYHRLCVQSPEVDSGRVTPNCSTYKIIVQLLAQNLQVEEIFRVITQAKIDAERVINGEPGGGAVTAQSCKFWSAGCCDRGARCLYYHSPNFTQRAEVEWVDALAFMHVQLARAAALLGMYRLVKESIEFATVALEKVENLLVGKSCREWGESLAVVDVDPAEDSSVMFKRTTRQELLLEIQRMNAFCGRVLAGLQNEPSLVKHLCRTLIFRHHTVENAEIPGKTVAAHSCILKGETNRKPQDTPPGMATFLRNMLFESLRVGFGLEIQCKRNQIDNLDTAKKYLCRCITDDCKIDFGALFSSDESFDLRFSATKQFERHVQSKYEIRNNREARQVKMEICAGNGDWVVAQAKEDPGSDWIALELRHERIHSIFSRAFCEGITNLCALGGDATQVLQNNIRPGSISYIFINFPEPPHHSGSRTADNRFHLLTSSFFECIHTVLIDDGVLTLFSDNHKYMRSLANTISSLLHEKDEKADEPMFLAEIAQGTAVDGKGSTTFENVAGMRLYQGLPGIGSGHIVHEQSYFDRFWKQGSHADRYFMIVSKN